MAEAIAVSAAVTKLIDKTPDVIKESIVNSVLKKNPVAESLILDIASGFNSDVDAFFNYGYTHFKGTIPTYIKNPVTDVFSGLISIPDFQKDEIADIIEQEIGEPVSIDVAWVAPINYTWMAGHFLAKQSNAWWESMRAINYNINKAIYRIGNVHFTPDTNMLSFQFEDPFPLDGVVTVYHTVVTDMPFVAPETLFYHVRFTLQSQHAAFYIGSYFQWTINAETTQNPILQLLSEVVIRNDRFLPIVPIRKNKVNVMDMGASNPQLIRDTKHILRYLNINLESFTESLVDPDDPNGIKDVEEVVILFAMDIESDEKISLKYLYEAFKSYHYTSQYSQEECITYFNSSGGKQLKNHFYLYSDSFSFTVQYEFTTLQIKNGLASGNHTIPDANILVPVLPNIDPGVPGRGEVYIQRALGVDIENNYLPMAGNTHLLVYRKQLTAIAWGDATDTYTELLVRGLRIVYHVFDRDYRNRQGDVVFIRDQSNMSDGGFIFPIAYDLVKNFNGAEESQIYYESLRTIVYAYEIQKLKWYQTGLFKALLTIAIIVVSVLLNLEALGAALASGLWATVVFIVITWITSFIITKALTLVVKLIGGKLALILAAIIAITSMFYGEGEALFNLLNAKDLMFIATSLNGAVQQVTRGKMLDLMEEQEDFLKSYEERQEEIDNAKDLLDNGVELELYDLFYSTSYVNIDESPTDFYNRAIHQTNPGVLVLDVIEHYVDANLTLPKPSFNMRRREDKEDYV